jgi:hypothetical protein
VDLRLLSRTSAALSKQAAKLVDLEGLFSLDRGLDIRILGELIFIFIPEDAELSFSRLMSETVVEGCYYNLKHCYKISGVRL